MGTFQIDWRRYRVIDLSYEVVPGASKERYFEIERDLLPDKAFMHHVRTHTHVGTHVEMGAHFFEGGPDAASYPLDRFMGRALLLDVPDVSKAPIVTSEYLDEMLGERNLPGDIIICRNSDPLSLRGERPLPSLSPGAAQWFANHEVKMIGIDTHFRLGQDVEQGRALHHIFMLAGGVIVEFLDHLDEISQPEFFFMALPFKARAIDSAWARAIAIEERPRE
ncbi:MAG: cyclase family protein [Anaerolineae bacterium]|nr:cyclase family protein [Anaerolineae bacterium]